jgi:uncharacterized protein (TIRG00374 family)
MELASALYFRKWVSISAFLGFTAFLLYLYFFTDLGGIASVIGRTNLLYYSFAFLFLIGSVFFNALAWDRLLESLSIKVSFRKIFNLSWVGIFVDGLIPGGWSGDAFMAYLLSRSPTVDGGKTAASIVIKNILEVLIVVIMSFLGLILLALNYTLEGAILIAMGTAIALPTLPFIIIIYLSTNLNAIKKILSFFKNLYSYIRRRPANIEEFEKKMEKTLEKYSQGIESLKSNPKTLFQTIFLQATAWTFEIVALFVVFASIGYPVPADKVIITNVLSANLQSQGLALAGFAQVVSSSVYTILGISPIYSAASTVLAGFVSLWFKMIIGFCAFQFVVFSRCVPPFCIRVRGLRGKSCEEDRLLPENNGNS